MVFIEFTFFSTSMNGKLKEFSLKSGPFKSKIVSFPFINKYLNKAFKENLSFVFKGRELRSVVFNFMEKLVHGSVLSRMTGYICHIY